MKDYTNFKKRVYSQSLLKKSCVNLIASENVPSEAMLSVQSTDLDNRYSLHDFPNNKFLIDIIDELEDGLCKLFSSKYADCTPLSGMNCMELVLCALADPTENIYIIPPTLGGHTSTAKNCALFGLAIHFLPISTSTQSFDLDQMERDFKAAPPKLIYLDYTLVCFFQNPEKLSCLAHKYNAFVVYDASHVLGLIAGGAFPNPLNYGVDCLCGSTHKTFPGPQKAIILSNNLALMTKVKKVAIDFISSIHTNSILALYVAMFEMQRYGNEYASQIIKNSKALGERLASRGICIPTYNNGISQTHQVWVQTESPKSVYKTLAQMGINTNCMRIPPLNDIGLRLGTAEVTRLGMKEEEMRIIADCIADVVKGESNNDIRQRILALTQHFNKVRFSIDEYQLSKMLYTQHCSFHNDKDFDFNDIIRDFELIVLRPIPHYCGMIVRGGVGRGTADIYSDIDFTCVFDVNDIEVYRKSVGLARGMFRYNGYMFSARYISLKEFSDGTWSEKMKHAYQFSKPISCTSQIMEILKEKTFMTPQEQRSRIISNLIDLGEMCRVYSILGDFEMFSEVYKHYQRKEYAAAHVTIDLALKYIKNIIFDMNGIYYPEEKSYYTRFFSNLPIQPTKIRPMIEEILLASRTPNMIAIRLNKLKEVSKIMISFIKERFDLPKDIYRELMNN